jgi:hypothetical protein
MGSDETGRSFIQPIEAATTFVNQSSGDALREPQRTLQSFTIKARINSAMS